MCMAILTNGKMTPPELLDQIVQEIRVGNIKTWSVDERDGIPCFTSTLRPHKGQGFLRPSATSHGLAMAFVPAEGVLCTRPLVGLYQGRFAEMLMVHDDAYFQSSVAVISMSAD